MLKFLIIFLLLFGVILFGFLFTVRFLKNTFTGMFGFNQQPEKKKKEDIIYDSDEVVVLKGEAKNKTKKEKGYDK